MNLIFLLQIVQTTSSGFSFIFVLILFILLIRLFMGYESICYKLGRLVGRLKFRHNIYRYKIYRNKTRLKKTNNSHPSVKYEKEDGYGVVDQSSVEIDINKIPFAKKETLTYEDELQDERWLKKREKILRIHGYKCPCGCRENLQIHHKYYNKYPDGSWVRVWDYPDNALMILCDDCHGKYHKNHKSLVYYRKKGMHYEKV